MLFTRCTLTNWPKTSNRTSDIERPPARQGIRTFPVIGYLSPRLLWTWARWWGCCRCCCCCWRRRCNKKHPRVVKFYVWLCVALRYPVAARPRPRPLLTIELVIGREMATGNANGMVWDGPGMCQGCATPATFVVSANSHFSSLSLCRVNEAIAVTCSPTPWGNNSRLFGKSTACFIPPCNFRWVFLWRRQQATKAPNQLQINVANIFPSPCSK